MATEILDVPYLVQPTPITCQSTCLKMFAMYLAAQRQVSSPAAEMDILDIWKEINTGNTRPSQNRNSYENMRWWLEKNFAPTKFEVKDTKNDLDAIAHAIGRIDAGYPVMVSTNHSRTDGHIILVVGYENYSPRQSTPNFKFICHDPYGKFNPSLGSTAYGNPSSKRLGRFAGGSCLAGGGETGPGQSVRYNTSGIQRLRSDKHSSGTFFMVSAKA